jgi:hypothetical protein
VPQFLSLSLLFLAPLSATSSVYGKSEMQLVISYVNEKPKTFNLEERIDLKLSDPKMKGWICEVGARRGGDKKTGVTASVMMVCDKQTGQVYTDARCTAKKPIDQSDIRLLAKEAKGATQVANLVISCQITPDKNQITRDKKQSTSKKKP